MKLIMAFLLFGILLFGCAGKVSSSTTDSSSKNANIENAKIGEVYTIDYLSSKYQVTLTKTAFKNESWPVNKKYLMAYFEIKNIGDSSEYFVPTIYVQDSAGERYDNTVAIDLYGEYEKTLDFAKQLNPGQKMSGWTAIEVPRNQTQVDVYFEYTDAFISKTPNYIKWSIQK